MNYVGRLANYHQILANPLAQFQCGTAVVGTSMKLASRKMASDHPEVTKYQHRNPRTHPATVTDLRDLSPTVKEVVLQVDPVKGIPFEFRPGHWVDMFIPGLSTVGGFSLTSTPKEFLHSGGSIRLAIKFSEWPPANWIHTKCKVGSGVAVRSGGDFTLPNNPTGNFTFVAGGVGVNPIASMIFHLLETNSPSKICLLFSAKSPNELIFRILKLLSCSREQNRFDALASQKTSFEVTYFVTGTDVERRAAPAGNEVAGRRMTEKDILHRLDPDDSLYVCGPPSLMELCEKLKSHCKVVEMEKWWK